MLFTKKINKTFEKTGDIDFQDLTDFALKLSQANFAVFNIFKENTKDFETVAFSGDKNKLLEANDSLDFELIGKIWKFDPDREEKINKKTITVFKKISELVGGKFPEAITLKIEEIANVGEVVIIRIEINNETAADFTILMDKNISFTAFEEAENFAMQVGIFIEKLNISRNLLDKEDYNFIIESTGVGTWLWDLKTNKVKYSKEWKKMLGYSDNEVEDSFEGWKRLWHPEDILKIEKAMEDYKEGKSPHYEVNHRILSKSGAWKWILTRGTLYKDNQGNGLRWLGINVDLTDIKEIENKYEILVDNSYDIIYKIDIDGRFEFISQAWTTLLGHGTEDILGKSTLDYIHPEDLEKVIKYFKNLKKSNKRKEISDYRMRHIDGSWHIFTTNATPILDELV